MGTVTTTKRAPQEDIEKIAPFIFRRWLSNDPRTIGAINFFNVFNKVPISAQYDTIQSFVGGRINYIAFPKKLKDESAQLALVQKYYNLSPERAKEYLEFLSPEDIKVIEQELQDLNPRNQAPKLSKGKK